jgi:hypothetical protein
MVERPPGGPLWCERCAALEIVLMAEQLQRALGGAMDSWVAGLLRMTHAEAVEAVAELAEGEPVIVPLRP